VDGRTKDRLVEQVEEAREDAADEWIGAVNSPANDDVSRVACVPELREVAWIALAVGVETEEILGLAHFHTFAHSLGVAFASFAQVEAEGKLGGERAEDLLGIVPAAVFANDESDIGDPGELCVHPADCCFNAFAFVVYG